MVEFLTTTLGAAIKSLAVKAVTGPAEKAAKCDRGSGRTSRNQVFGITICGRAHVRTT